jgi:Asp-tRNA(Asn)/Glu-tRNA(Gln) amidotransferase A subunit family amidase
LGEVDGLPAGLSVLAAPGADALVLALAHAVAPAP